MDDHSRFLVGYGLHASQSAALVLEVVRAAMGTYGVPAEVLTDNGSQYVTWRGKSAFAREMEKHGVKQVVAAPRRPQTLGKIDLTPPGAATGGPGSLPDPVCPHGTVTTTAGFEDPPAPGASPLDDGIERVRQAFASDGGAS